MSDQETCQVRPTRWYEKHVWRLNHKIRKVVLPVIDWIHSKVAHCDSPEYFQAHPKMVRWTGGLRGFCWTYICGHGFGFAFHIGNIYWRFGKRGSLYKELP